MNIIYIYIYYILYIGIYTIYLHNFYYYLQLTNFHSKINFPDNINHKT